MVMEDNKAPLDASWSMAAMYYLTLNRIILEKTIAYQRQDMNAWYLGVHSWFKHMEFKIGQDESLKIQAEFRVIKSLIVSCKTSGNLREMVYKDAGERLDQIELRLMRIMDEKKMIFPRIEGGSGLTNMMRTYGLTMEG